MSLYILFGLPGAGKTFVGKVFEKDFGFYFYDGDLDVPRDLKQAIDTQRIVPDGMRDRFFNKLIPHIKILSKKHNKLVVAQTFIKEKYRKRLLAEIPNAHFVLIKADKKIREERLKKRKELPLDIEYTRKMTQLFDPPKIDHVIVFNNTWGKEDIKRQVQIFLGEQGFG